MTDQSFETMRHAMVASQLRTNAVNSPRLVAAMSTVERERFVPDDRAVVAYIDRPVPLGNGRALNPPMTTGLLINESDVLASDKVLLVGAATGYAAAILARLAGRVTALESDRALAETARRSLGTESKVEVVEGPLEAGWPSAGPFDAIIIDGAVDVVPPALVAQLVPGGRLAAAVVDGGVVRLAIGRRAVAGEGFGLRFFLDAEAVRLPGFIKPSGFEF